LYLVPENQEIWVVRCDRGQYFRHFREHGVMAIGHMDSIVKEAVDSASLYASFSTRLDALASSLAIKPDKSLASKAAVSAQLNQVQRFCEQIKPGDLVVSADGSLLAVGRVTGNAFIDEKPLEAKIRFSNEIVNPLRFRLRREVAWGPVIERKEWPLSVRRALSSNMTVFSLGHQKRAIYHLLYPAFEDASGLHTTVTINQPQDIDNFSISTLFRFLSQAEAIALAASEIDDGQLNIADFESRIQKILFSSSLLLTSKAQFMSEGDIQSSLPKVIEPLAKLVSLAGRKHPRQFLYFFTALTIIGGNNHLGYPGLIDKEMIRAAGAVSVDLVASVAKKMWDDGGGTMVEQKLQPSFPKVDTTKLVDASKDAKQIALIKQ
jgi:hypothetical protein